MTPSDTQPDTQPDTEAKRRAGRPRDERVDQAILDAAIELLAESGVAGMTMDAVAERAGVAKTTIYRRWDAKEALVVDAVHSLASRAPAPDTGSLRGDLIELVRTMAWVFQNTPAGRIAPAVIGELPRNPALAEAFRTHFLGERKQVAADILVRAKARGELPGGVNESLVPELLIGPLLIRILIAGQAVRDADVAEIVDFVMRAVEADR